MSETVAGRQRIVALQHLNCHLIKYIAIAVAPRAESPRQRTISLCISRFRNVPASAKNLDRRRQEGQSEWRHANRDSHTLVQPENAEFKLLGKGYEHLVYQQHPSP